MYIAEYLNIDLIPICWLHERRNGKVGHVILHVLEKHSLFPQEFIEHLLLSLYYEVYISHHRIYIIEVGLWSMTEKGTKLTLKF